MDEYDDIKGKIDVLDAELDTWMYLASGLQYEHQRSVRSSIEKHCEVIQYQINELKENLKLFS